jgi:hypothetical protein
MRNDPDMDQPHHDAHRESRADLTPSLYVIVKTLYDISDISTKNLGGEMSVKVLTIRLLSHFIPFFTRESGQLSQTETDFLKRPLPDSSSQSSS